MTVSEAKKEAKIKKSEDITPDGKHWCLECHSIPHECTCDWFKDEDGDWIATPEEVEEEIDDTVYGGNTSSTFGE